LFIPVHILSLRQSLFTAGVEKYLKPKKETYHNNDKYLSSGIHRLACPYCGKACVDQTGRGFNKGFTEHQLSITKNNTTSKFVQHV
jgi:hypothetical protein